VEHIVVHFRPARCEVILLAVRHITQGPCVNSVTSRAELTCYAVRHSEPQGSSRGRNKDVLAALGGGGVDKH